MCRSAVGCILLKSRDMTKFKSFDDVPDFAISREIEAQAFHLKLAQEEAEHKLRFEIEYDLITF